MTAGAKCTPSWAGLNLQVDGPDDLSTQPPTLWLVDSGPPITQLDIDLFTATHDSWILVLFTSYSSSLVIPGRCAGTNLRHLHIHQRRSSWRTGTTLTKRNRVSLDSWSSDDLSPMLVTKLEPPSLAANLTPDGKVQFRPVETRAGPLACRKVLQADWRYVLPGGHRW